MREQRAVKKRRRHVNARRPDIRDENVAGVRLEAELARRPSACARAGLPIDDQAAGDEFPDALRHDRSAQAGSRRDLAPRLRAGEANGIENGDQRASGLIGHGTGTARRRNPSQPLPTGT